MYDNTLYRKRKHFCRFCSQAFSEEKISKLHIKDWLKIHNRKKIKLPKKDDYVRLKKFKGK